MKKMLVIMLALCMTMCAGFAAADVLNAYGEPAEDGTDYTLESGVLTVMKSGLIVSGTYSRIIVKSGVTKATFDGVSVTADRNSYGAGLSALLVEAVGAELIFAGDSNTLQGGNGSSDRDTGAQPGGHAIEVKSGPVTIRGTVAAIGGAGGIYQYICTPGGDGIRVHDGSAVIRGRIEAVGKTEGGRGIYASGNLTAGGGVTARGANGADGRDRSTVNGGDGAPGIYVGGTLTVDGKVVTGGGVGGIGEKSGMGSMEPWSGRGGNGGAGILAGSVIVKQSGRLRSIGGSGGAGGKSQAYGPFVIEGGAGGRGGVGILAGSVRNEGGMLKSSGGNGGADGDGGTYGQNGMSGVAEAGEDSQFWGSEIGNDQFSGGDAPIAVEFLKHTDDDTQNDEPAPPEEIVADLPVTGDSSSLLGWAVLLGVSAMGLCRKRR